MSLLCPCLLSLSLPLPHLSLLHPFLSLSLMHPFLNLPPNLLHSDASKV
jgi:hypothetical protein